MSAPLNHPSDDLLERLEEGHDAFTLDKSIEEMIEILTQIEDVNKSYRNNISFYEFALARCCSIICQSTADKFQPIQKVLIKYLFSDSDVASLFASDLYMFIVRAANPNAKVAMYKIVENLVKLCPESTQVKGIALMNRISTAGLI